MPSENVAQSLVDDIVEHEPKVREEIIANLRSDTDTSGLGENGSGAEPVSTDSSGDLFGVNTNAETATGPTPTPLGQNETFDPNIHEVNPDGTPRTTKDGKYRRKRGRRGGATGTRSGVSGGNAAVPPVGTVTVDYNNLATITTNLFFTGTTSFLGKAWEPTQAEVVSIHSSTKRFLEHYQIEDIPPGLALVLAVGIYALPRLNDDETKRNIRRYARSLGFNIGLSEPQTGATGTGTDVPSPVGEPAQHGGIVASGNGNSNVGGNGNATFNSGGGRM